MCGEKKNRGIFSALPNFQFNFQFNFQNSSMTAEPLFPPPTHTNAKKFQQIINKTKLLLQQQQPQRQRHTQQTIATSVTMAQQHQTQQQNAGEKKNLLWGGRFTGSFSTFIFTVCVDWIQINSNQVNLRDWRGEARRGEEDLWLMRWWDWIELNWF